MFSLGLPGRSTYFRLALKRPWTEADQAVTGIDRQESRDRSPLKCAACGLPDPYKNKGVRYAGERLKKKVARLSALLLLAMAMARAAGSAEAKRARAEGTVSGRQDNATRTSKNTNRRHVHERIRKKILELRAPALNVYRSLNHIHVQLIDDLAGNTVVFAHSAEGKKCERRTGVNKRGLSQRSRRLPSARRPRE